VKDTVSLENVTEDPSSMRTRWTATGWNWCPRLGWLSTPWL